MQSLSLR